jgi:hypothetical protein
MFSSRLTLPLSRKCSPNDHIASRSRDARAKLWATTKTTNRASAMTIKIMPLPYPFDGLVDKPIGYSVGYWLSGTQ